jgi:hypothetical protein
VDLDLKLVQRHPVLEISIKPVGLFNQQDRTDGDALSWVT